MKLFSHLFLGCLLSLQSFGLSAQVLKSIVYDFDGFDLNATSLPEGDYSYGDLSYVITTNPLAASAVLGDRVLKLNLNWNNGYAAFGRGISRFIEFDRNTDQFHFYFYNPPSNNQQAQIVVSLADDDNQNNTYESSSDDLWQFSLNISSASGWQKIDMPFTGFIDGNTGGNGVMDMAFTQNKGMLLLAEFRFSRPANSQIDASFFIDHICFSESGMPTGSSIHDLPAKSPEDYCPLGAFEPIGNGNHQQIPINIEGLFPAIQNHHLKYVNTYMQWASSGTTPNAFPGNSIQTLLNNGYRPIITWEPMYLSLAPLDPAQPKLADIANGSYDAYITAFADAMKNYSDTTIVRFMHEFDGDWYSWCVSQNGQDPSLFVNAFRRAVNIFRARGATKVKWMWCCNSDYAPYQSYNWAVQAYPGDTYVDYVATDIYNGHYPLNLPWWRSFRWLTTESYYYLRKYFPSKPFIICELGCRARISGDDPTSQSKPDWYADMDQQLQSNFSKTRGLIFFNTNTGAAQNWIINSDAASLQSLSDNIWKDNYYFFKPELPTSFYLHTKTEEATIGPNPSQGNFYIWSADRINFTYDLFDSTGRLLLENACDEKIDLSNFPQGIYFLELKKEGSSSNEIHRLINLH